MIQPSDKGFTSFLPRDGAKEALALVVDDESTNRLLLRAMLRKSGYQVIEAHNGQEAIAFNDESSPDIIFMDIMMPVMDGYSACREIKRRNGKHFVPIIFLTAVNDEKSLSLCIESGGDDFLLKPFSNTLLRSKIMAHERNRVLHQELHSLYNHLRHDEEIAERVFSNAVLRHNVESEHIKKYVKPASLFSGDVFLTAHTPSGDLQILLGDFTGHGLSAAIGALPVSEVFHTMTKKGFSIADILNTINKKLHELLPTEMFMAAILLRVDVNNRMISYYNCGMPPIIFAELHVDTKPKFVASGGYPLGIIKDTDYSTLIQHEKFNTPLRIILASDGVSEARNEAGVHFGDEHLKTIIDKHSSKEGFIELVSLELNKYCGHSDQDDDISIIQIDCTPSQNQDAPQYARSLDASHSRPIEPIETNDGITFKISLFGNNLRAIDPIPVITHQIKELAGVAEHLESLFTVLTELYVNALDHGVLALDSALKSTPDGFYQYYSERESRLNKLNTGYIHVTFHIHSNVFPKRVSITIEDSGEGFDITNTLKQINKGANYAGRGILLVGELCHSVQYQPPGNHVVVEYLLQP